MITGRDKAELIKYKTSDGITQYGMLSLSKKGNKSIIIHEHGMCSNFFSGSMIEDLRKALKNTEWDFFSTNNRGTSLTNKFYRKGKKEYIGTAYEEFTECIYDIKGAITAAKEMGYKNIILSGQSTGCQKITYYMSKNKNPSVKALILLAPTDDYSSTKFELRENFNKAVKTARALVKNKNGNKLMPEKYSKYSARRFLSFANPNNPEAEIFNYSGELKTFSKINIPILALIGSKEENAADKNPEEMIRILKEKTNSRFFTGKVIKGANHGFNKKGKETGREVKMFAKRITSEISLS